MHEKLKSYMGKALSLLLICIGIPMCVWGLLQQCNTRTNAEDNLAWFVWAVGMMLLTAGATRPFLKKRKVYILSILSPCIGFAILTVLFWIALIASGLKNVHHQPFSKQGMHNVEPAMQMAELYDHCTHSIVYTTRESVSTWNAVAHFGSRYKLTMQVPVSIESSTEGEVIGEPEFYLSEVEAVKLKTRGLSFSRNLNFGIEEWEKVYTANGDWEVIGFTVKTEPLKDFEQYIQNLNR